MKRNVIRLMLGVAAMCAMMIMTQSEAKAFGHRSCGSHGGHTAAMVATAALVVSSSVTTAAAAATAVAKAAAAEPDAAAKSRSAKAAVRAPAAAVVIRVAAAVAIRVAAAAAIPAASGCGCAKQPRSSGSLLPSKRLLLLLLKKRSNQTRIIASLVPSCDGCLGIESVAPGFGHPFANRNEHKLAGFLDERPGWFFARMEIAVLALGESDRHFGSREIGVVSGRVPALWIFALISMSFAGRSICCSI